MRYSLAAILTSLVLTGCNQQLTRQDAPRDELIVSSAVDEKPAPAATQPALTTVTASPQAEPAEEADIWQHLVRGRQLADIRHPRIDQEVERLLENPTTLNNLLSMSEPFLFHIISQVEARGMPLEIALLPAVESGYRPYVQSSHGAAGLWQFMPATGKHYGLKQDWWMDSRRDPLAATNAALTMLQQLNMRFEGNWLHALAAYNAGGGRVSRAISKNEQKNLPTDFWSLDLPGETDDYVPRLLAMARIISEPEKYGLQLPEIPNEPYFTVFDIQDQIDLNVAAELAGIKREELLKLNAGFNRWATHPDGPHRLLLPVSVIDAFEENLYALPDDQRLRWTRHKIQQGDNLGRIARKYGVSISAIQKTNNLKGSNIRAGKYLNIPLSESATELASTSVRKLPRSRIRYKVRKGDSLYRIARKFDVKVADLRKWNKLPGRYLKPGQRITVLVDPATG